MPQQPDEAARIAVEHVAQSMKACPTAATKAWELPASQKESNANPSIPKSNSPATSNASPAATRMQRTKLNLATPSSFAVVAGLTEPLPIGPPPKQFGIAAVRHDMVNHRCQSFAAFLTNLILRERQKERPRFPPLPPVASSRGRRPRLKPGDRLANHRGSGTAPATEATVTSSTAAALAGPSRRLGHARRPADE